VANLNIELQKVLNPEDGKKKQKAFRNYVFREGDRVMQIKTTTTSDGKNQRPGPGRTGVFNGDMGIIVEIDDEEQKIKVLFDDEKLVEYDYTIWTSLSRPMPLPFTKPGK